MSSVIVKAWLKYCAETREYWERQARLVTSLSVAGTSPEQVDKDKVWNVGRAAGNWSRLYINTYREEIIGQHG
jgi:predicted anti-sigma-YlaC factor YlaD